MAVDGLEDWSIFVALIWWHLATLGLFVDCTRSTARHIRQGVAMAHFGPDILFDWSRAHVRVFVSRDFHLSLLLMALFYVYVECVARSLFSLVSCELYVPCRRFVVCIHRVYIVIRLFIRIAEYIIARPKHRRLRRLMQQSKSYPEWYAHAAELDKSQKRDRWLRQDDDGRTSSRYNWAFIRELIKDLQQARATGDSLLALAVLQQCTRKVEFMWRLHRLDVAPVLFSDLVEW
jgi:Domain of unknown function (DUF3336)